MRHSNNERLGGYGIVKSLWAWPVVVVPSSNTVHVISAHAVQLALLSFFCTVALALKVPAEVQVGGIYSVIETFWPFPACSTKKPKDTTFSATFPSPTFTNCWYVPE